MIYVYFFEYINLFDLVKIVINWDFIVNNSLEIVFWVVVNDYFNFRYLVLLDETERVLVGCVLFVFVVRWFLFINGEENSVRKWLK